MNSRIGQHLTLLGLCALVFYGVMLASGQLTLEILPQFLIAAIIFLSSGRVMKRAASLLRRDDEDEAPAKPQHPPTDWSWLTTLLNWTFACLIIGGMALLLLKPVGLSWQEALSLTMPNQHYFAGAVP